MTAKILQQWLDGVPRGAEVGVNVYLVNAYKHPDKTRELRWFPLHVGEVPKPAEDMPGAIQKGMPAEDALYRDLATTRLACLELQEEVQRLQIKLLRDNGK